LPPVGRNCGVWTCARSAGPGRPPVDPELGDGFVLPKVDEAGAPRGWAGLDWGGEFGERYFKHAPASGAFAAEGAVEVAGLDDFHSGNRELLEMCERGENAHRWVMAKKRA
jgi:hypothetical protein